MTDAPLDRDQAKELRDLDAHGAADVDTVATIVVEVRDTASGVDPTEVDAMLRRRLTEARIELPDDEVRELVRQILEGD
ncbi:hypothetical protein MUN76_10215 [Leucobacter rhizosphaerae]|uniref:Uncharacterized protein n=1 Tax=Leucobacter rhizosphaerae TaxID=2932245 RepID=A0ABY4FT13_9MICO|nr:hypothetical protein [Leucobacter rhizosphaerae]UOQ59426.1 hypothetical protein MUN76_10215 [Leucobacter rhizosphaerae]